MFANQNKNHQMWGKNVQNRIGKIGILSFNIQH